MGAFTRIPLSAEALIGYGPSSALDNALSLMVLGLNDRVPESLEFVPRLKAVLADPLAFNHLPDYRRREAAGELRQALHLGVWLLNGEMDRRLAHDAYESLLALSQSWGGRFAGPGLLDLMSLLIESGDHDEAVRLYQEHERHPLPLPPTTIRFSTNARALLSACASGRGCTSEDLLLSALDAFRRRATRWDRDVSPIPYVMKMELARTLHACSLFLDRPYDLKTIAARLK